MGTKLGLGPPRTYEHRHPILWFWPAVSNYFSL